MSNPLYGEVDARVLLTFMDAHSITNVILCDVPRFVVQNTLLLAPVKHQNAVRKALALRNDIKLNNNRILNFCEDFIQTLKDKKVLTNLNMFTADEDKCVLDFINYTNEELNKYFNDIEFWKLVEKYQVHIYLCKNNNLYRINNLNDNSDIIKDMFNINRTCLQIDVTSKTERQELLDKLKPYKLVSSSTRQDNLKTILGIV